MAKRMPYVLVVVTSPLTPEELGEEGAQALGVWEVMFRSDSFDELAPEDYADAALDCFHGDVGVDPVDDFCIEVYVDGVLAEGRDDFENGSLEGVGEVEFITDDPAEVEAARQGRFWGQSSAQDLVAAADGPTP